jgi:3-(methylthio)propionyl---CoA ligase
LRQRRIGLGDTVAIIAPKTLAVLEVHYGLAMAGPVLNALKFLA